jgi:predicted NAD-dependent protein-ADP-ribosyltransferase YbiA (DUF1768 family)
MSIDVRKVNKMIEFDSRLFYSLSTPYGNFSKFLAIVLRNHSKAIVQSSIHKWPN